MDDFVNLDRKRKIVLSDVKTRVNSSIPKIQDSRGAEMQLRLYHLILSNMIEGIDICRLCSELKLDPNGLLSDGFLAEAGAVFSSAGIVPFEGIVENTLKVRYY